MELGYTIPLQRHLKVKSLPYGSARAIFCWDLHIITLRGQEFLLAVNCANRFTIVLRPKDWSDVSRLMLRGIRAALGDACTPYLAHAGSLTSTRTHGRREVAFLNRAWEDVIAHDWLLEPCFFQAALSGSVNALARRCAGHEGLGASCGWMREDLSALGITL